MSLVATHSRHSNSYNSINNIPIYKAPQLIPTISTYPQAHTIPHCPPKRRRRACNAIAAATKAATLRALARPLPHARQRQRRDANHHLRRRRGVLDPHQAHEAGHLAAVRPERAGSSCHRSPLGRVPAHPDPGGDNAHSHVQSAAAGAG